MTSNDDGAPELDGMLVLQLEVGDQGHTRKYFFGSISGAEKAVARAEARGKDCRLTLCRITPVGEVT